MVKQWYYNHYRHYYYYWAQWSKRVHMGSCAVR